MARDNLFLELLADATSCKSIYLHIRRSLEHETNKEKFSKRKIIKQFSKLQENVACRPRSYNKVSLNVGGFKGGDVATTATELAQEYKKVEQSGSWRRTRKKS